MIIQFRGDILQLLEQIQSHPIYITSLPTALEKIRRINEDEETLSQLDNNGHEVVNKLDLIINQLNYRLNSIDPHLLRVDVLNGLNSALANIVNNLNDYKTSLLNQNNLNNINAQINTLLANLVLIPIITNSEELLGLKDNIASFRHSMSAQKGGITKLLNELGQNKDDILEEFKGLRAKFDELEIQYLQIKDDISVQLEALEDKSSDLLETTNNELDILKNSYDEQINKAINALTKKYDDLEIENNQFIIDQKKKFDEKYDEFKRDLIHSKEEYDDILENHKNSVEDLLGIISTNTISSHYKEVADIKEKNAGNWKKITVSAFVCTIVFGIYAFMFESSDNPYDIISRIIVTTALGSFTAYAANQVSKYEKHETFNRQMEVELKTLNPYIASFDPEEQIKLKENLFPQVFGKADRNFENNDSNYKFNLNSPETNELLKQLLEKVKTDSK